MYSLEDRSHLLDQIVEFMQSSTNFEGLLLIGSGAVGFTDIYSDIDLMAGCIDADSIKNASTQLDHFFNELAALHIEHRAWSDTVLGISVYFPNGLSCDISFMPTEEIPLRTERYCVLFSKSNRFIQQVDQQSFLLQHTHNQLDNSIHYRFVNELRYCEIASLRGNYVFAEIALGNARKILLMVEAKNEGKKTHQFKAFNTLYSEFLADLADTYPKSKSVESFQISASNLLEMYLDAVQKCDELIFNRDLLGMLGKLT